MPPEPDNSSERERRVGQVLADYFAAVGLPVANGHKTSLSPGRTWRVVAAGTDARPE